MGIRFGLGFGFSLLVFALGKAHAQTDRVESCQVHAPAIERGAIPLITGQLPPRQGIAHTLYIRARFSDETDEPVSEVEAHADLEQAHRLFSAISYRRFGLDWTITPVVELPHPRAYYEQKPAIAFEQLVNDSRAAAEAVGYSYLDYDWEIVRHTQVSGRMGGEANLGVRGARISGAGPEIIVHELGHNLGLSHAQFWDTKGPSSSPVISPPFPSNAQGGRDEQFDPDSFIGHDTIIGLGHAEEYGDPFDIMGSGSDQYDVLYKFDLGWLDANQVHQVGLSGRYRIYAMDVPGLRAGCGYGVRILRAVFAANGLREYWVQYRPGADNASLQNGAQIHWGDGSKASLKGSSLLLDLTPGSPQGRLDSALPMGMTFSDPALGLFITAVAQGEDTNGRWLELAIEFGEPPGNQPPTLNLTADQLSAPENHPIMLQAVAADANHDPLVFHWDFADDSAPAYTNIVSKSWRRAGDFVVRCEVSDLHGGKTSSQLVVRIGIPLSSGQITGKVTDPQGVPLAGVRVHNGRLYGIPDTGVYVSCLTDSLGRYTLTGLPPGLYTNNAFLFGYVTSPAGFTPPISIASNEAMQADFILTPLPRVTVTADPLANEAGTIISQFVITRTGPTNAPLTVNFALSGQAQAGADYASFLVPRVTIPAGVSSATLPLIVFNDGISELPEPLTMSVQLPTTSQREVGKPEQYTVFYPGWERAVVVGQAVWAQTNPDYVLDTRSTATVTILDRDLTSLLTLTLGPRTGNALTIRLDGQAGAAHILEASTDVQSWLPIRTNFMQSPTWIIDDLRTDRPLQFYRGRQP
jgi:hypothetical protein